MKKKIKIILFSMAVCASFLISNLARAEINFNPISPQPLGITSNISCSVGDALTIWNSDGGQITSQGCPYDLTGDTIGSNPGTFTIIECLTSSSTSTPNVCFGDYSTINDARTDPGYISESNFIYTDAIIPITYLNYIDEFTMNMLWLTFILLIAVMIAFALGKLWAYYLNTIFETKKKK